MKAVIVDDSRILRKRIISLISDIPGIEIACEAQNSNEAMKLFKKVKPEVVILDIRMPGMDGIDALGRILGRDNTMPTIIHTAYAHCKDDFMTSTADHYIVKSSDLSELKAKIREALE